MPLPRSTEITVVWELGGGLGHAARLAPIIRALVAAECSVSVVARAPQSVYDALGEAIRDSSRLTYYRAPPLPPRGVPRSGCRPPLSTIAEVLVADGFADIPALSAYLGGWRRLLGPLSPSLIISDFAPFANLVASGMAPVLTVGNGYTIPPPGNVCFVGDTPTQLAAAEHHRLLDAISTATRKVGATAPTSIGEAFRGVANFPLAFPCLDPYIGRRPEKALTPYALPHLTKTERSAGAQPTEVFVYLPKMHRSLAPVIRALSSRKLPATIYARGTTSKVQMDSANIRWLDAPADLATLLPRVNTIVHSGNLGMAHAGLIAGTRQILLPSTVETRLTANSLVRQGAAIALASGVATDTSALCDALDRCQHDPMMVERSAYLATHGPKDGKASLDMILTTVAALSG